MVEEILDVLCCRMVVQGIGVLVYVCCEMEMVWWMLSRVVIVPRDGDCLGWFVGLWCGVVVEWW